MTNGQFHRETFQGILNQYLLKFKEEERLARAANILLIISGVFGFAYFNIGIHNLNEMQFVSILPLLLLYGYSMYYIATTPSLWPWVAKRRYDQLKQANNSEQVYKSLINQMYTLTGDIDRILRRSLYYIWVGVYLLSLSVLWTFVIYYINDDSLLLFIILLPLSYILGVVIWLYWKLRIQEVIDRLVRMNQ